MITSVARRSNGRAQAGSQVARIRPVILFALMLVAGLPVAALAAGCGGGSGGLRTAEESDLSQLVLRADDVPGNYRRFDDENSGLGLQHKSENGSDVQFVIEYELDPEVAKSGELACISAGTSLYDTPEAALAGLATTDARFHATFSEALADPSIGADAHAYHSVSDSAVFCSGYENEPAEQYFVIFARSNTVSGVVAIYRNRGGSIDEAIAYAKKQLAATNDVLD